MEHYQVIRSSRRSIGLEIRDGRLLIRAPYFATRGEIEQVLAKKQAWIRAHLEESRRKKAAADAVQPLSREELRELAEKVCQWIPRRAAHYAALMGVSWHHITIRAQKKFHSAPMCDITCLFLRGIEKQRITLEWSSGGRKFDLKRTPCQGQFEFCGCHQQIHQIIAFVMI